MAWHEFKLEDNGKTVHVDAEYTEHVGLDVSGNKPTEIAVRLHLRGECGTDPKDLLKIAARLVAEKSES